MLRKSAPRFRTTSPRHERGARQCGLSTACPAATIRRAPQRATWLLFMLRQVKGEIIRQLASSPHVDQ